MSLVKRLLVVILQKEGEIYCSGELCNDIEYADFWLDDEDTEEYRKKLFR